MSDGPERVPSVWDETQLDSITAPPTDLKEQTVSNAVEAIEEWFFANFEDPAENTPRDDGDFVYIWGGPYDAEEIIRDQFEETATEEQIKAALARIEGHGYIWVPNNNRVQPPEDEDSDASEFQSAEELHAEMLAEIANIEEQLADVDAPGIGHNHPPEALE